MLYNNNCVSLEKINSVLLSTSTSFEVTVTVKFLCDKFVSHKDSCSWVNFILIKYLMHNGLSIMHCESKYYCKRQNTVHFLTVFKSAMAFKKRGKEHINSYRKMEIYVLKILVNQNNLVERLNLSNSIYNFFCVLDNVIDGFFADVRAHNTHIKTATFATKQVTLL